MKISGIVVLYNPQESIYNNIHSYIEELQKLYIIDNSEVPNFELNKLKNNALNKIEYIQLNENKGIAVALNIGLKKIMLSKSEWILTMDQDSKFPEGEAKKYFERVLFESKENSDIGIFSPLHLLKTDHKKKSKDFYVSKVMCSGNIISRKVINSVGVFNENFFIDEVDHEFCYRVTKNNFKIKILGNILLNHDLGRINKKIRIPKIFLPTNHNPLRRYYITRNKLYVFKSYPEVRIKYSLSFVNDFFKIIMYEDKKLEKIKMIKKAFEDFKQGITGKINERRR